MKNKALVSRWRSREISAISIDSTTSYVTLYVAIILVQSVSYNTTRDNIMTIYRVWRLLTPESIYPA